MSTIQRPYGTFDILPEEVGTWQYIEKVVRDTAKRYGFGEIRFPTFEATELFSRGVGDTSDIVQKEMYTFNDRDKRTLTLRPEGTACVVRSIIENGLVFGAMPLKLFYIANFFRHEKAQKGRSREFWQFGCEIFGSSGAEADATAILLAKAVFDKLGIKGVALHLNSIGCPECRPAYREKLVAYLNENIDSLCPTCVERMKTNPLRVLDCKNESCRAVSERAPKSAEHLCGECERHFSALRGLLDDNGADYIVDTSIVRGLDYYTRTVFEFIDPTIGAQSTICGGGRYSGLVSELGGPETDAVGFGMGITRLIAALENSGVQVPKNAVPDIYIAPLGEKAKIKAFSLAQKLRGLGVYAETDICGRSLKAQMKYADKIGAKHNLVIGDNELETGQSSLKSMSGGGTVLVGLDADEVLRAVKE